MMQNKDGRMKIKLSRKGQKLWELMSDDSTTNILTGGAGGGSKTMSSLICILMLLMRYPGIKWGLARHDKSILEKTTISTLVSKVHPMFGITKEHFKRHLDGSIRYVNGSSLSLQDLQKFSADPEFSRFGGLELTGCLIEEADQCNEKAINVYASRVGRWKNDEYGIVGKVLMTCNPTYGWLKDEYYLPYENLGDTGFQRWQDGHVMDYKTGEMKPAYKCFLKMTAYDNPWLDPNYIENLKRKPTPIRRRLLDGDWNFADDDNSLFPSELQEKSLTYDYPEEYGAEDVFIGIDPADSGKDQTGFTLIIKNTVVESCGLKIKKLIDESELESNLYADEIIKRAERYKLNQKYARHIAVEKNGVGVGILTALRNRGWKVTEYVATAQTRSENFWNLHVELDDCKLKIWRKITELQELKRELLAHEYKFDDAQKIKVISKDKIKDTIARSPDLADSCMIANYCRTSGQTRLNRYRVVSI